MSAVGQGPYCDVDGCTRPWRWLIEGNHFVCDAHNHMEVTQ